VPASVNGHGPQPSPERQRLLPGVEHKARESPAQALFKVPKPGQVLASYRGPGFNLDRNNPAVWGFQDRIYLDLISSAVVVETRTLS
jgi:hypothetical protein